MDGLFLEILNLSLYGSFAIVAVLILRFLLKKSPKSISYGLWLVVFLALILPVRIKTSYSPMPVGAGEAVSGSASGGKRHFCCG